MSLSLNCWRRKKRRQCYGAARESGSKGCDVEETNVGGKKWNEYERRETDNEAEEEKEETVNSG